MKKIIEVAQHINFITESCELIRIPMKCFRKLKLEKTNDGVTMEAIIVDDGTIESEGIEKQVSPIQRLFSEPDIARLEIYNLNGEVEYLYPIWFDEYLETNDYQRNELIDYKTLAISIKVGNKSFSLIEALELAPGTVIVDQNGKEYLIINDEDGNYVLGAKANRDFLESRFTLKY